jgi:hypothetical protein
VLHSGLRPSGTPRWCPSVVEDELSIRLHQFLIFGISPGKTREGARSGVTRLDRMKHGSGIKDRDDRSRGIEIRIAEVLAKINLTDPLILAK